MARLTRNEIEGGTQADKRRAMKNKVKQTHGKASRQNITKIAKKDMPLRRGQGG
jgi:hypothetical protein